MILWSIQISIVSILLIVIVHHLFLFLQNNFSIPIIKDFVELPKKYENILNIIEERKEVEEEQEKQQEKQEERQEERQKEIQEIQEEREERQEENIDMKNELKNFLKSIV